MELRHSLKQLAEAHRLMETGRHAALIEEIGGRPRGDFAESPTLCLLLGTAHARLGQHEPAAKWTGDALTLAERQGDWTVTARSRNVLGGIALEAGRIDEAVEHFREALAMAKRQDDHLNIGRCSNNLGIIANLRGQSGEAATWYTLAIAAYQQVGHDRGLAQTYHNLGITFLDEGAFVRALDAANQALDFAGRLADVTMQAQARAGRAEIRLRMGDAPFAAKEVRRALEQHRGADDIIGEAEDLRVLALVLHALGDVEQAETTLREVIERAQRLHRPLLGAWARRDVARLLDQSGRHDEAASMAREAWTAFEQLGAAREVDRLRREFER